MEHTCRIGARGCRKGWIFPFRFFRRDGRGRKMLLRVRWIRRRRHSCRRSHKPQEKRPLGNRNLFTGDIRHLLRSVHCHNPHGAILHAGKCVCVMWILNCSSVIGRVFVDDPRRCLVRDVSQSDKAPFPYVFDDLGWVEIKWVATIGAIFAMSSTLVCNMFALPRIFYAMASDGVIFKVLAIVNQRTKTPILATIVSGLFAGTNCVLILNFYISICALTSIFSVNIFVNVTLKT